MKILRDAKFNLAQRSFIIRHGLAGEISDRGRRDVEALVRDVQNEFQIYDALHGFSEVAVLKILNLAQRENYLDEHNLSYEINSLIRDGVSPALAHALAFSLFEVKLDAHQSGDAYRMTQFMDRQNIYIAKNGLKDFALAELYAYLKNMDFIIEPYDREADKILEKYGVDHSTRSRLIEDLALQRRYGDLTARGKIEDVLKTEGFYYIDRKVEAILDYAIDKFGADLKGMHSSDVQRLESIVQLMEINDSWSLIRILEKISNR